jgi:hypothetical protein
MGWNQFCLEMENSGQKKWLTKIKKLDENIMLNHLETRLMEASRDGRTPNRALLEATVKALQGVTALNKVSGEDDFDSDGIEVRFVPSLDEPIEPETAEQMYERLKSELSLEGSDD